MTNEERNSGCDAAGQGRSRVRTLLRTAVAAHLVIVSGSLSAADPVVAPPVGFVRLAIPAQSDAMVSIPFRPVDSSLEGVLFGQLQSATKLDEADRVFIWDADTMQYHVAAKMIIPGDASGADGRWYVVTQSGDGVESLGGPVGDAFRIQPGAGLVLRNRQNYAQSVCLSGRLVVDATMPQAFSAGLNLAGFPYTSAGVVSDTQMASVPGVSDIATNTFMMGAGYWVRSATNVRWVESRPYPVPFATNADVRIADIVATSNSIILDIAITRPSVKTVDILYRDLAPSDSIAGWTGWQVAGAGVDVRHTQESGYVDTDVMTNAGFKGVRLYLAVAGSADKNGDGIPDDCAAFCARLDGATHSTGSGGGGGQTGSISSEQAVVYATGEKKGAPLLHGSRRSLGIVYVDIRNGADSLGGRHATRSGGNNGPKKSVRGGMDVAENGDVVVISEGDYCENLNIAGRNVSVLINGKVDLSGPVK